MLKVAAAAAAANSSSGRSDLVFSGPNTVVAQFDQLWAAIPLHPGGHVILENAGPAPKTYGLRRAGI